ncbi:MAG: RNA-guided endonuclease InsQ/TnpB family protein [Heteroscytonema crispum UTEX LB 1556]
MLLSIKTKLDLTNEQTVLMSKHAGIARFTYNWGLATWQALYKDGFKPNHRILRTFFNNEVLPALPWIKEKGICQKITQYAFEHLGTAFKNFFTSRAKYPNFKKKNQHDSFTIDASGKPVSVGGTRIKLPTIGWVRTFEALPHTTTKTFTISRSPNGWYISFAYSQEKPQVESNRKQLTGVDLGITALATLADGKTFANPKSYRKALKQLSRLQRQLQHKVKGSKRRIKAKTRLAKFHQRITNIKFDTIHKMTHYICKNHAVIGLEDLNVSGMVKNSRLSQAISDAAFGEILTQLEYKSEKFDCFVHKVDRFYPSTKTCNHCKHIQPMPLSKRTFECEVCGKTCSRDENAALNLALQALNEYNRRAYPVLVAEGSSAPSYPVEAITKPRCHKMSGN